MCGTENATTKEMNQTENVPFPKQNKTPQSTWWYAKKEIIHIIYWMKMKRTGKKKAIYKNNKENREKLKQQKNTEGKDTQ